MTAFLYDVFNFLLLLGINILIKFQEKNDKISNVPEIVIILLMNESNRFKIINVIKIDKY